MDSRFHLLTAHRRTCTFTASPSPPQYRSRAAAAAATTAAGRGGEGGQASALCRSSYPLGRRHDYPKLGLAFVRDA
eukprot:1185457-Prorocentrum_minimum.AAC.1